MGGTGLGLCSVAGFDIGMVNSGSAATLISVWWMNLVQIESSITMDMSL